jgi:hypothetical protein
MATALTQLQVLPAGGIVEVGAQGIEHVLAVRYEPANYPHHFVWLTPWELAYLKRCKLEIDLNYPLDYLLAILRKCPQVPINV